MQAIKPIMFGILCALVLAGCIAPPAAAPTQSPTPPPAPPSEAAPAAAEYALETLAFEGNGNTFLAAIQEAAGAAQSHRFVELTDEVGNEWQGEQLGFEEGTQLYLQLVQRGGTEAVRIEGPADFDMALATSLLPNDAAKPIASPHPEIRFVRARQRDGLWRFDVTLAYPDTGWTDYADGWHVATPDGEILGTRVLLHPHENEQPFTRSLSGVEIPDIVSEVVIRSHDLVSGYSPDTLAIPLEGPAVTDTYEVVIE